MYDETFQMDRRNGTLDGVARYALDSTNAARLWDVSEKPISP
jgi:hypothetical protein